MILLTIYLMGVVCLLAYAIACIATDEEFKDDVLKNQDPVRRNGVLLDIIAWPIPFIMMASIIAWEELQGLWKVSLSRLGFK